MSHDQSRDGLGVGDFLSIGSFNLVCVLGGMGLGWWADAATGLTPVLTLLGLALGVGVGVLGSWLRLRPLLQERVAGEDDEADDG
jgi:F0F1-type ATP synthase assembly protein I